ncbi:MAG TPA: ElyC/SanA/YdcF family protein, partial [Bacteroidia bacterium]|nr:ElyC/SanA/YdcF family protein [Bacteroidia bacterium]
MIRFRRLFIPLLSFAFLTFGLLAVLVVFVCDRHIERSSAGRHTSSIQSLSPARVALVLGCAETLANGRTNLYFRHRIKAAAELHHRGLCQYLLVSGDNSRPDYDETADMRRALIALGVPDAAIYQDHAGFDTLDSVVRAKQVFGQEELIIVSQPFHNERALYLARHHGIRAQGWDADDVPHCSGLKTRLREKLA